MTQQLSDDRYKLGRAVMLISAILYSLSRAATYIPNATMETPKALDFVSLIVPAWVWAGMWLVATALCIMDLIRGAGRYGISSIVGLMFSWAAIYAFSYAGTVVTEGWGSREWSTAAGFGFGAGMILGLIIKVGALKRQGEHE